MADAACDVRALVLNYRGAEMTLQVVRDLLAIDDVRVSVVVLDNGSGPDEQRQLEQAVAAMAPGRHELRVVTFAENLGFAAAMSRGLRAARDDGHAFVLVCNNDLRLPADSLRPLLDVLRNDARVAAVGPTIVNPDGTVWAEGGEVGFTPNALRLRRQGQAPTPTDAGPEEVDFLTGACVLLRADAALAVGAFPDDYFMYWEDVALSHALRRAGHGVVWIPWVRVEHLGGRSSGGGRSPLRKFLMACNAVRFLKAHGSALGWLGWLVFDVLLWPVGLLTGPSAALAKLRGTWRGLLGHAPSSADVRRYLGD
ncbi:MAG: glycosyltransferase family 2 protein [Planctomycetes bacterium]|nr:glycosyltransferase family 2 protein [Planctomycetota bacterium]